MEGVGKIDLCTSFESPRKRPSRRRWPRKLDRHGATPVQKTVAFVEDVMNGIIYLVGLIVVIMAILSFLGLR